MTPKTLLLTTVIALITGTQAFADSFSVTMLDRERGNRGREFRGREFPNGEIRRGRVAPVRPNPPRYPGNGGYRPGPVYPGPIYPGPVNRYIQRVIYINHYVSYETLYLQQLSDLLYSAGGYTLESVEVESSQASYDANMQLLVNGYVESSDYGVNGLSVLYPNYNRVFGRDLATLALRINGSAYIGRITVNMRLY